MGACLLGEMTWGGELGGSARESDRGERMGDVTLGGGGGIDKGGGAADRGGGVGDVILLSGAAGGGGACVGGVGEVSVTVALALRGDLIPVLGLRTGGEHGGGGADVDEDIARFNDEDTGLEDEEEEEEELEEEGDEEGRRETGGGGAGTRGRMLLKLGAELER